MKIFRPGKTKFGRLFLTLLLSLSLFFAQGLAVFADPDEDEQAAAAAAAQAEAEAAAQAQIEQAKQQQELLQGQIAGLEQQKGNTQGQLSATRGSISTMQGIQASLSDEMDEVDQGIAESIASIQMLEEQIGELEIQIEIKQGEYDEAKHQEEIQYEAMKNRVRFMYEKGEFTYMELLLTSSSFGDMLNKADYVEKLYEYDRDMLFAFQETQRVVEEARIALEDEQAELEESQHGLEEEKASLEEKLAELQDAYEDYESRIASAQAQANELQRIMNDQQRQISNLQQQKNAQAALQKQLEQQKTAAAAPAQTAQAPSGGKTYNPPASSTGSSVVSYACQFVGNPYVYGGTSLTNGCDCSGFTQSVYKAFGYSLPRTDAGQRGAGIGIDSLENAAPGDLICYAGHVAIYCGGGQIVHASTARTGIKYSIATYRPILAIRRIIY